MKTMMKEDNDKDESVKKIFVQLTDQIYNCVDLTRAGQSFNQTTGHKST